jgi:hypothetical protein
MKLVLAKSDVLCDEKRVSCAEKILLGKALRSDKLNSKVNVLDIRVALVQFSTCIDFGIVYLGPCLGNFVV